MTGSGDRLTRPTDADVDAYLAAAEPQRRRDDALEVLAIMRAVSNTEPRMWGESIVGFGRQPYRTADGKDREWFAMGLAPRKAALTLYGLTFYGSNTDLLERLGRHRVGKGCLYISSLAAVDREVLTELVERAWAQNHQPG